MSLAPTVGFKITDSFEHKVLMILIPAGCASELPSMALHKK